MATAMCRPESTPESFQVDFPADAARLAPVRHALQEWLAEVAISPIQASDIVLAAGEACTNAIEHGHDGDGDTVHLSAALVGSHIRVVVADRGRWMTPDPAADPSRGRGMAMMRALSSEFAVKPSDAGTVVDMLIPRQGSQATR
ncbi:ATP-binding protein [Nocardia mangyaensis]|uniref:ATP-binding protein n=1 Tax=Nocardia mangyaensis TaxID=2213200 RepID=UPI0026755C60|nr:ATP-binding protein [Nocardia mangyaensis]MDO3647716.1 ATP-binding protein [Nocardia mangyaensis]